VLYPSAERHQEERKGLERIRKEILWEEGRNGRLFIHPPVINGNDA
jgi:hypothetical protein